MLTGEADVYSVHESIKKQLPYVCGGSKLWTPFNVLVGDSELNTQSFVHISFLASQRQELLSSTHLVILSFF